MNKKLEAIIKNGNYDARYRMLSMKQLNELSIGRLTSQYKDDDFRLGMVAGLRIANKMITRNLKAEFQIQS